jgi:hypothetical protein
MALMPDRAEQAERAREWQKELARREKEKEGLMGKYGDRLGTALSEYKYLERKAVEKRRAVREVLTVELALLFTNAGNPELAISAMMEMLEMIDTSFVKIQTEIDEMGWVGPY